MASPKESICEVCHQRPATIFVSHSGVSNSAFCSECAPSDLQALDRELRDAHCDYCSGQPASRIMDDLALTMGIQKPKYICSGCMMEYSRFILDYMRSRDWSCIAGEQEAAAIQEFVDTADAHMREWVSSRDTRGDV
jgi:protein-arginine kinase activator protein McsA